MKYLMTIVWAIICISCMQGNNRQTVKGNSLTQENYPHHPTAVYYSKHARCRMDCRHITDEDIRATLANGYLNEKKSNLSLDDCHKRYAIEYKLTTQNIRVIAAFCNNTATIITCIDLGRDWECHCPGDTH
ncbi:MAG: DUF4258 domain-containing protein [Sphingobacteriia bacterium]|nr:DUF4258 domain-containing protein [Sphingobacteriia bacterium]